METGKKSSDFFQKLSLTNFSDSVIIANSVVYERHTPFLEVSRVLEELKTGSTVVGLKQLRKVLKDGTVQKVFLARNAEPRLVEPIEALCREKNVPCIWVDTMAQLGTACGIDVGAAAAALL